jgi:hypothetical protein
MVQVMQVLSIVLVAVGLALTLSHALEFPGKLRLPKDTYIAVQSIYYPGFTIGGVFGEFGAMVSTLVLLIVTPWATTTFWLTLGALVPLLIMHVLYWVVTHPVNKIWLKDQQLQGAGAAFFGVGGKDAAGHVEDQDWTALRDRWEYSHVARAVFAMLALMALATASVI